MKEMDVYRFVTAADHLKATSYQLSELTKSLAEADSPDQADRMNLERSRTFLRELGGRRAVTEANLRMAGMPVEDAMCCTVLDLIEGKPRWDRESRKVRFAIWLAAWRDLRLNCSATQKAPLPIVETNELQRLQF